jgi:hypothetical protein
MSLLVICRYIYTASPIHPNLGIRRLDHFPNLCISVTGKLSCHLFPSIRHPSFSSPPRAQPSFRRGDLLTFTFALDFLSFSPFSFASITLHPAPSSSLPLVHPCSVLLVVRWQGNNLIGPTRVFIAVHPSIVAFLVASLSLPCTSCVPVRLLPHAVLLRPFALLTTFACYLQWGLWLSHSIGYPVMSSFRSM